MRRAFLLAMGTMLMAGTAALAADKSPAVEAALADAHRPAAEKARDAERKPAEMVAFAGIEPGDVVVDLMPGSGYFTRIFADVVGKKGHVYAYLPTEFDAFMKKKGKPIPTGAVPGYPNATYIHASVAKVAVPRPADLIWTSQNYHDLHNAAAGPVDIAAFNKAVYAALKPGGVFIVLDHAAAPGSGLTATETLHRIDPATVKQEVTAAGFQFVGESTVLRNPADDHTKKVFDASIRGHTDQFIYKFRKP